MENFIYSILVCFLIILQFILILVWCIRKRKFVFFQLPSADLGLTKRTTSRTAASNRGRPGQGASCCLLLSADAEAYHLISRLYTLQQPYFPAFFIFFVRLNSKLRKCNEVENLPFRFIEYWLFVLLLVLSLLMLMLLADDDADEYNTPEEPLIVYMSVYM